MSLMVAISTARGGVSTRDVKQAERGWAVGRRRLNLELQLDLTEEDELVGAPEE